jgi:hypothetical protein
MPVQLFPGQVYWAPMRTPYTSSYYDDGYDWYIDSPYYASGNRFDDYYVDDSWYSPSPPLTSAFNSFGDMGTIHDFSIVDGNNAAGVTYWCDGFGCEAFGARRTLTPYEMDNFDNWGTPVDSFPTQQLDLTDAGASSNEVPSYSPGDMSVPYSSSFDESGFTTTQWQYSSPSDSSPYDESGFTTWQNSSGGYTGEQLPSTPVGESYMQNDTNYYEGVW